MAIEERFLDTYQNKDWNITAIEKWIFDAKTMPKPKKEWIIEVHENKAKGSQIISNLEIREKFATKNALMYRFGLEVKKAQNQ